MCIRLKVARCTLLYDYIFVAMINLVCDNSLVIGEIINVNTRAEICGKHWQSSVYMATKW